jgi:diguanylate cyclase (GGDEF)-like protein
MEIFVNKKTNPYVFNKVESKKIITQEETWTVLIVDDEEDIHVMTKMALDNFSFAGRKLKFLNAYSGESAQQVLRDNDDIACIFLDVVMESHDAGLLLVQFIREELQKQDVRIILRTGQPGYAPAMSVIQQYDINDYKEKSELTKNLLYSCLTTTLRSYQQIKTIESSRAGLEMIIEASSSLLTVQAVKQFSIGILTNICALLHVKPEGIVFTHSKETNFGTSVDIMAAAGQYSHLIDKPVSAIGKPELQVHISSVLNLKKSTFIENYSLIYIPVTSDNDIVIVIDSPVSVSDLDQQLLQIFSLNIAVGFNNASMFEHIEYLAYIEPITLLPNKSSLMQYLTKTMSESNSSFLLVIVEIDNFSAINDGLGFKVGEKVVALIAKSLADLAMKDKFVASLGDGSFALVLPFSHKQAISEKLLEIDQIFKATVKIENSNILVSLSAGVNVFEGQDQSAPVFFSNTCIALKKGKEYYKAKYCVFNDEMNLQLTKRLHTINELHNALDNNELFLLYQPQINLDTKKIIGVEALVRWRKPDGRIIPPIDFIEAAEDSGLIVPIGLWVLKTAIKQSLHWKSKGFDNIRMAVNVSPRQMSEDNFVDEVNLIINQLGISPSQVELEITESMAMTDTSALIEKLKLLRNSGFQIAIDDFGTGYSSLSYLQKLPVDRLKIDGSFIRHIDTNREDASIAEMIINMGHKLNLEIIAECVESLSHQEVLIPLGCDEVQGYLYAKPLSGEDVSELLKNDIIYS